MYISSIVQELLTKIEAQHGKFKIEMADCGECKACWSWKKNTIELDPRLLEDTEANRIAYIVFELYNAFQVAHFQSVIKDYQDVDPLIIGQDTEFEFKHVSPEFSYHYALNQVTGHSERIATMYFPRQKYRGTLYHPLEALDQSARELLHNLLYCHVRKRGVRLDGQANPVSFDEIVKALENHSKQNPTYKKTLECAASLFQLKRSQ